jgi:transcriptional pleiotropic regulator of transition state genes
MNIVSRKIDKLGRIVLPMDFRKALGLEGEAEVVLGINGNAITVKGVDTSCKLCGSMVEVSKSLRVCSECIRKIRENN